jgi:hypothetical protein
MTATVREHTTPAVELVKMFAILIWVAGATAVTLGILGRTPAWLAGEERHVRIVETVDDAARRAGGRLYLPAYFPRRLAWPPEPVSPLLLGKARVLHESRTTVGNTPASIANVLADGASWQQLSWQVGGIQLVLRARSAEPELHRLAHGLRREGSGP